MVVWMAHGLSILNRFAWDQSIVHGLTSRALVSRNLNVKSRQVFIYILLTCMYSLLYLVFWWLLNNHITHHTHVLVVWHMRYIVVIHSSMQIVVSHTIRYTYNRYRFGRSSYKLQAESINFKSITTIRFYFFNILTVHTYLMHSYYEGHIYKYASYRSCFWTFERLWATCCM